MANNKIFLSGIKPTGTVHLGNYIGMLSQMRNISREHKTIMFIADLHALNIIRDAAAVREHTYEIAAIIMSIGFNMDNVLMFRQSDVPAVCELSTMLTNVTPKGLMDRAHSYKAATDRNTAAGNDADFGVNMGLYTYPILMAADILLYGAALNTRIRISSGTLSPDIVNSGARTRPVGSSRIATCFKAGFLANFEYKEEVPVVFRNLAGTYNCYYGGELVMEGIYDVTMKLPPVPTGATYEIRLSYYANEGRGVSQIYLNDVPCGIPLDLRLTGNSPKVGWISDTELGDEETIEAYDHAMHNRGLMKSIDSYQGYDVQRDRVNMLRSILATEYLEPERDYYLRIRQVLDNDRTTFQTDNIEIVPKSVYQGIIPEDRH